MIINDKSELYNNTDLLTIPINPAKTSTETKSSETSETSSSGSVRSTRRKLTADVASSPRIINSAPPTPTVASDDQITTDLAQLNNGKPGAWDQLMNDIGGAANLSTYRTSDGLWSLLSLCGRYIDPSSGKATSLATAATPLTVAATTLLNNGFQFTAGGIQDIPPRFQWAENDGYCGETSLISAGLANGEYISQYDARLFGTGDELTNVVLGDGTDKALADAMHLQSKEYSSPGPGNTADFVNWMQAQLAKGDTVAMGVYMNHYTFDGDTNPNAGSKYQYEHIVTVTGITPNPSDPKNPTIHFSDHGLYSADDSDPPYEYSYPLSQFIGTRQQANVQEDADPSVARSIYTMPDDQPNFAIAIPGINKTLNDQTFPIHLLTDVNDEANEIGDGSTTRPDPTNITLTGCITGLTPHKQYKIYVYDKLSDVPDGDFNKHAGQAARCITFTADGSSYVFTDQILSSAQIAYRVVPA